MGRGAKRKRESSYVPIAHPTYGAKLAHTQNTRRSNGRTVQGTPDTICRSLSYLALYFPQSSAPQDLFERSTHKPVSRQMTTATLATEESKRSDSPCSQEVERLSRHAHELDHLWVKQAKQ